MRALALFLAVPIFASDCSRTTTPLVPIDDLGPGLYRSFRGGLYTAGANRRPTAHAAEGLRLAGEVVPRNAAGAPDDGTGRILLLSIGMSNTTQEFSAFVSLLRNDPERNPRVVAVDGAQGGWTTSRINSNGDAFWTTVDQRIRAAGPYTADQVQVIWMKEAEAGPTAPFPEHARLLERELATLIRTVRARFSNLRLLYLSSRTYGGYASTALNPEPYAYESAFAVKWVIERQIQGDPELSYETGRAPWLSWGPYLWAAGMGTRSDGLSWACSDFGPDGTHPSDSGRGKVARMLLDFFKSDPTTRPWFLARRSGGSSTATAVANAASWQSVVAPGSIASLFGSGLAGGSASAVSLPLPQSLLGATVEVDGLPSLLLYVSSGQINLVVPREAANGTLSVLRNGVKLASMSFGLTPHAPALFVIDGNTAAAALHPDYEAIGPADPARRGETILLFGTGLGGAQAAVAIGGVPATITYCGSSPGSPGLDQINVVVPASAPAGPAVPVELSAGPDSAPAVTLPIS
jgi:uncharacterized protein (TIGR03437 family)